MEVSSGKAETLAFLVPPQELEARRGQERRQLPGGSDGDRLRVAMQSVGVAQVLRTWKRSAHFPCVITLLL